MRFVTSHFSVAGKVRPVNEDSLCYRQAFFGGHELVMAVICDGMGGMDWGEKASGRVVRSMYSWFETRLPVLLEKTGFDTDAIINEWKRLIGNENKELYEYGMLQRRRLGTTISAILIYKSHYVVGHVGDCRIYKIGLFSRQLTRDQSLVAEELSKGIITRRQARHDSRSNILLECVGASEKVNPIFRAGTIHYGKVLLCSDGFWHGFPWAWASFIFADHTMVNEHKRKRAKLGRIINWLEQRGETDNISAILISIGR